VSSDLPPEIYDKGEREAACWLVDRYRPPWCLFTVCRFLWRYLSTVILRFFGKKAWLLLKYLFEILFSNYPSVDSGSFSWQTTETHYYLRNLCPGVSRYFPISRVSKGMENPKSKETLRISSCNELTRTF
jgi:hypothetical protein